MRRRMSAQVDAVGHPTIARASIETHRVWDC
jgi:hypothetical protein